MAYCTQTDLTKLYPEKVLVALTNDAGGATVVTAVVDDGIAKAGAEIDAYCGARYSVPFSPVPVRIRDIAVDLAWYHLFSRRGLNEQNDRDQNVIRRYRDAVAFLKAVAAGTATLGADAPGVASGGEEIFVDVDSEAPVLSRGEMKRWA